MSVNLGDDLAITVVVVYGLDLSHSPKGLKCLVIELIDVRHMRVGDDDVG